METLLLNAISVDKFMDKWVLDQGKVENCTSTGSIVDKGGRIGNDRGEQCGVF